LLRSLTSLPAFTFPDAHLSTSSPTAAATYHHQHRNRRHFTASHIMHRRKFPGTHEHGWELKAINGASFHHLVNIITTAMTTTLHLCRGSFKNGWTDGWEDTGGDFMIIITLDGAYSGAFVYTTREWNGMEERHPAIIDDGFFSGFCVFCVAFCM